MCTAAARREASSSTWIQREPDPRRAGLSVWNGHYAGTCYHPLFGFNQFGDLERSALRPGNVHSAERRDGVLKPVVTRYQGKVSRIYFRADAAFAMPGVYEFLQAERIKTRPVTRQPNSAGIGLATCSSARSADLRTRCVGSMPISPIRREAGPIRAGSIAKVEWHPGELYPRVGFIVTNMAARPTVVAFYNKRRTSEQWIKEGKGPIKWTRLSCRTCAANAVRLQLHALAYNLGNFCARWRRPSRSRTGR